MHLPNLQKWFILFLIMENKESFAILIVFALIAIILFTGGIRLLKNFVGSIPSSKPTNQEQEMFKKQYKDMGQIRIQQKEELDRMRRQTDDLQRQMRYRRSGSHLNKVMMNNLTHLMQQRDPRFMETLLLTSNKETSGKGFFICKLKNDSNQTLSKIGPTQNEQKEQQRNIAREQRRLNEEKRRHEKEMEKMRREHDNAIRDMKRQQEQQKIQSDFQRRQAELQERQWREMMRNRR